MPLMGALSGHLRVPSPQKRGEHLLPQLAEDPPEVQTVEAVCSSGRPLEAEGIPIVLVLGDQVPGFPSAKKMSDELDPCNLDNKGVTICPFIEIRFTHTHTQFPFWWPSPIPGPASQHGGVPRVLQPGAAHQAPWCPLTSASSCF